MLQVKTLNRFRETVVEEFKYSQVKRMVQAIRSPRYTHSRSRKYGTAIYHRDPSSPSTVIMAYCGPDELVTEILRRNQKTSPLSPTEMLSSNRAI